MQSSHCRRQLGHQHCCKADQLCGILVLSFEPRDAVKFDLTESWVLEIQELHKCVLIYFYNQCVYL